MTPYRSKKAGENIRQTYDVLLKQWGVDVRHTMIENVYGRTHVIICGMELVKGENMNAHFYPDAGHGLNHEKAEEINQYVLDILRGRQTDIRNY